MHPHNAFFWVSFDFPILRLSVSSQLSWKDTPRTSYDELHFGVTARAASEPVHKDDTPRSRLHVAFIAWTESPMLSKMGGLILISLGTGTESLTSITFRMSSPE